MAQLGSDVLLAVQFVADDGTPYTPSPAPTVTVSRINASGGDDTTLVTAQATVNTGLLGIFSYVLAAASNSALGTLVGNFVTTDTGITALLRNAQAFEDVEPAVSVDLTQIEADLATLLARTVAGVVVQIPVNPTTLSLTIVRGDDYSTASGRTLPEWESDDWTPYDLSAAASVTFRAKTRYNTTVFSKAMNVLSDTQVRLQLTDAETAAFAVGTDAYNYDIEAILSVAKGSDTVMLARGKMSVIEDVR